MVRKQLKYGSSLRVCSLLLTELMQKIQLSYSHQYISIWSYRKQLKEKCHLTTSKRKKNKRKIFKQEEEGKVLEVLKEDTGSSENTG